MLIIQWYLKSVALGTSDTLALIKDNVSDNVSILEKWSIGSVMWKIKKIIKSKRINKEVSC